MLRRTLLALAAAAGGTLATRQFGLAQTGGATPAASTGGDDMATTDVRSGYAPVNGLEMYYEIHGEGGVPLVLIHGAFGTVGMWGSLLTTLAQRRQVVAVELQGHGHTADVDRPFDMAQMADDVAALVERLDLPQVDVAGYSLGSGVALQLALRHPGQVRKVVLVSAAYRTDGFYPEVLAGIQSITPEAFAGSPMETAYQQVAPNPDDWPVLIEKIKQLDARPFAWPEADIRAVAAPALVVNGDADVIRPEHAVELARLLGGAAPGDMAGLPKSQLAILPATTHISIVLDQAPLLLAVIEPFLTAPMPEAG